MNAHCFKTVFSTRLGALVAVGEHALTQGKAGSGAGGSGVGSGAGAWSYVGAVAVGLALTSAAWAQAGAPALPSGAQLAQGAATVQTVAPGQMQIVQGSDRAVLNWQSFNVGSGGLVKIDQPTAQSMLLNRVVGTDASQILGRVQANGQVVLVNPNGVVFGKDGSVSASSFTASTLGISDADFMAGRLNFSRNGSQAGVRNEGRLQSEAGGYVALLGAKVENAGEIATRGGAAVLAAAEQVSIALSGTGKIRLALSPAAVDMAVSNAKEGVIVSEGGQVLLRAQAVNQAVASLLQSGKIDASAGQGGEVSLLTDGGLIKVDGSILANSTQGDKGGDIVIGRDLQTGVLAKRTDVSGSQLSSRGGFIETSGDWLKTDAVKVEAGLWLLDPADIVIDNFSGSNSNIGTSTSAPTTSYTPVSGAAASQIDVGVINTALASGNVVITTTNTGTAGAGNGDITLNAPISFAGSGSGSVGNLTLTADRDIILNASISNTYRTTLTATRDLRINENISAQDGITARAGRDVYVMKNFGGGTASSIEAAYKGGTPANGWMTGTGQVILDPAAVLSYNYALTLNSGLGYTSSGSTDTSNGARVNFSDSQLNWNNGANPGGWVRLRGFQDVSLSNARGGSAAVTIPSGTLEVQARNITVGTNLSAADMTLNAGMFESTAGATLGHYNNNNWINKQGALTLGSSVLGYSGVLDLRSGIANAGTGARTSIAGSNVAWSNSAAGALRLYGFDTVTTSSDVRAGSVDVFANQINQQGNINSAGSVRLVAASFDAAGNPLGSLAGNTTTPTGWQNLKGEIDISAGKTITGTSFDLRSGVNSSNTLLRKDFDAAQTLIGVGGTLSSSTASSLYLAGFRDVKLPNFTDITGAGSYQVFARNIDASTIPAGKFNAFTLRLWAGLYQDQLGVNRYSFNQVGRNGVGMGGDNNNAGTITLPSNLMVQSSVLDLSSGLTGVSGSQRVNFSPSSLGPYVDPSNPTRYTGAYYTTSGGVNTLRQGGARYLNLHGFNTVNLPATPLNYEQVDIGANNVVINADINAGQGSWWPLPFYLYIQAGTYNPTTGVSGGTNAGSVSFNNDPVIRVQGYTPAGFYGTASSPLGFNSYLQIINGATAADFTARLGYTKADYSAGGTGVFTNLTLQNFSNTRLQLENASDKITVKDYNGTGSINITQASGATGTIRIFNDLSAENTITLNAGNGSIRMGSQVAKAPTISLTTGANSAANIDADTLNVTSKNLGSTLVVNEANNVTLANSGANTDTGNIEINARGELSLGANFTRSGAGNTASLTLRADAQFGNTLDTSTGNWQSQTLNTVFSSYNNGTTGELGGDGYGAIRVSSAQPTLVLPSFRQVAVVDAAAGFTTPANNTSYFRPDGTLYPNSTLLPQGSIIVLGAGVSPTAAMDLMTASGSPYRIKSTVTQGGWSVTAANTFFNSSGVAYASGTLLPVGTEVYYKTSTAAPSGNITNTYPNGGNNGQQLLYVVGGYTTTNSVNTVPDYVSKGTSFTASYNFGGLSASLASSATTIGGDTPVDVSQAANYYGNPVSGTNNRLHMSGQFYTFNPGSIYSTTGYLGGTQAAPTQINQLATGTGNNSTTGNGWDTSWGTATITTAGGDLRLFSGPRHALAGPGYGVGDPADLNIFTNPVTNDFVNTKSIKDSAFALNAGTGNLVALGFRDVLLDPSGTLSSSGNVTIGAARDMVLNNNSNLGGSGSLTTLLAGGMITNKVGGVYNTLGASTGAGASNLMVLAGGGVDLRTNMASVVGSLQDNPLMTGVLAGGMAPSGSFNIIGSNNQTAGLVVGGSFTNALVNDVTFDGTAGILYSASTPLSRTGINTKPNASGSGSVMGNYGAVTLSTAGNTGTAADIVVNGAINTQPTGGNVQLTAQRHVLQAADVLAGAGDVGLTASSGSISRTAGTVGGNDVVLSAATTIGSSSQSIRTAADTLRLNSAGNQFVSESDGVTLAASTTGNGAVVVSAGGTLTVGSASGLSGISSGSGEVNLKGNALAVNANIATTSNAFLEAVGNITANGAGRISAAAAVLSAGGSMGSAGSRVLTAVQRLALNANGDSSTTAFVSDLDGVQLSAKAPNGGGIDVQSASGNLVLDRFSLTPGAAVGSLNGAANAQGYVAPTSSSVGVDGTGNVSLQAVAGMVDVAKDLRAAGTVRVQGKTADGSTAVMLRSGVSLSNSATAGQSTTLQAEQGNIAAEGPASVSAVAGAGVIQLLAGSDASSAGSVDGSKLTITQSGAGTAQGNNGTVGVLVQTTGSGDVTGPKVINNGSGNVVLSAGSALAAGNAAGGQVKTVSGNSTSQLGGGKTYVYTGAAASSGDLELIDSSFSTLYLSQVGSNLANARTNTDFAAGPQHNSGSNSQVMVRERLSFTDKVNAAQLRITYGDADPSSTAVKDALKAANQLNGSSIVETVLAGSNSYQVTRAAIIDDLTVTDPAANGSPRHAGTQANGFASGYNYGLAGNNFEVNTAAGTAKLFVDPKRVTLTASKTYDGSTDMTGYVTISGLVGGQTLNYSGARANGKNVSAGVKAEFISAITLADGTGANAGLASDYILPDLTRSSDNNSAAVTARTVTLNASKSYDGKTGLSGNQLVIGNLVSGETLTYQDAQLNSKNVWEADHVSAVTLLDGSGGGLASNYAAPDLSKKTSGINEAKVDKARLSVAITGEARKVYDGGTEAQLSSSNFAVAGLAEGDAASIGFADPAKPVMGQYASKNVRDNTEANKGRVTAAVDNSLVQLTQGDARNYDLPTGDASGLVGVITPKEASVDGTATTKMYNGQDQSQAPAQLTGFIEADLSAGRIGVVGVATGRNVGTYTSNLSVEGEDAGNYVVTVRNADLTITKNNQARVVLTANSDTKQYNGAMQSVSGFTAEGLVGSDTADNIGAQAGASGRNAGVYGTSFSNTDQLKANYENVELKDGALTINKNSTARVVLTANSDTKQYNGATQSVSGFRAEGLVGSDTADNIGAQAGASGRNAGVYGTSFSNTDQLKANYENVELKDGALTINKNSTARVVLTANSDTKQYNGATQSVSGFRVEGLVGSDTADNIGAQAGASGRNAGVYGTSFSNTDQLKANYENVELKDGALTINKNSTARVVLTANSDTKQYNGATQSVSGFRAEGLVGSDTADNIGAQAGASGRNAGVYGTSFSNTDQLKANYENVELKDGALTINKNSTARVVLTANSDTKQYNGATQSVSGFTVTGLLGEDAADVAKATSGISAGASAKNAGRYSTAFSGSNAELEQNYANIDKVDGALTISKNSTARVVLTANSDTKEYNGATQSVSGFTVMGLLGEDAADAAKATSGISAGASARNAGRYSTTFSGSNAELEQNYANIDKVDGALIISKNSTARVVLAATGGTVEYNGSVQAVSGFTAEGLVGADKADNLGVSSGAQGRNAGRYGTAFQNTEQLQANYANVELRDAVLVIEPKTVTLGSITAADKVYDGSTAASITQATVVGTVAGETLSVLGEGQFEDKNVGQAKTVSVADVQSLRLVNGSGDWRNYKLQTAGALTSRASITPKVLSVLGGSVADKVFDGNVNASFTMGRLDGLVGQETLVVQGIDARFRDAQVGSDKPVDVRLSLANGANGGLVSNYILPEQLYRAAIQSSDQRPVDPRPIPPKDISPSRVAFLPPTSAGVSCRVEDLEAEYQRSGSVSDERLKQCACELTEETGVLICYAPQSETVAANVGKDR